MRNHFRILATFLTLTLLLSISSVSNAQPPPPPGGGHGGTGNEPPAGAPVGEGLLLLISLAGLYGGKKVYSTWKTLDTED